jgi:hypothetical protein
MPLKLISTNTGTTNFKLRNVNNSGRLVSRVSSNNQIITNGLTLNIDANDASSYNGSGATWYDISGNTADITLLNTPTYTSGAPSYFTFNGSDQFGTGNSAVLSSTSYTKSVWFYLNGYNDNNLVSSDTGGHFLYMAGGNKIYSGHTDWGDYQAYPSTANISLSTWYYVALTFSTTNGMTLYINGALDSTYTANKNAHSGDGSTNIATFGGGNLLNGRIAQVFCYNRELSSGEISQNYNATKATYGL